MGKVVLVIVRLIILLHRVKSTSSAVVKNSHRA
ncbi:MAG: hypothetical protein Hyperionvirus11_55 [Hyperionvirus sp.]|uniref:Uncharacterized protein n=1 Tax=Hyperionvirus sp. TaxID=2487770 RepID=A0A3G5A9M9_9VIRU|nr:MAG: hypothetical protein Hyperionvirus11_55 [Hyperionvirus sp.]